LTVLAAAGAHDLSVNISDPASRLITASSADASSTNPIHVWRSRRSASVVDRETPGLTYPDQSLRALNFALHRRDAQLVVFHAQDHFVASLDPQRFDRKRE